MRPDGDPRAVAALTAAALLAWRTPAVAASGAPSPFATPLALHTARLGDTLDEWRSRPAPGPVSPNVAVQCRAVGADQVCRYVDRVGGRTLPQSLPLFGRRRATDVSYVFVQDRLAQIRLRTSVDAFSEIMTRLKRVYGPAPAISRDRVELASGVELPRVRATWWTARNEVVLVDPSDDPSRLELRIGSPAPGPPAKPTAH